MGGSRGGRAGAGDGVCVCVVGSGGEREVGVLERRAIEAVVVVEVRSLVEVWSLVRSSSSL